MVTYVPRRLVFWARLGPGQPGPFAKPRGPTFARDGGRLRSKRKAVPLAPQALGHPDYVFWGLIDWHFRTQRPQHLAHELASRGRRVFYVSSNVVSDARPGFTVEPLDTEGRLFQVNLHAQVPPIIYSGAPDATLVEQLRASAGELLLWSASRGLVSLVQHPFWYDVARALPDARLVYDCMDDHEGFGNTASGILELEHALMRSADLLVATSRSLDERGSRYNGNRALIRNAADHARFSRVPDRTYRDPAGRQVIGYYGAIAEWFDVDLVAAVAQRFKDQSVLLIGADAVGARDRLGHLPNVTLTGEVAYADLPYYLHAFSVCLLPFKITPLTLATNPVKAYEFLSAGKEVVAVALPELDQFAGLVRVAKDQDAFLDAVVAALGEQGGGDLPARRRAFVAQHTWVHRTTELIARAEATDADPLVSVVVVTHNNIDLTRACLESLELHSDYPSLEVVVVDNASSDGSLELLREWAAAAPGRRLLPNPDNRGFAAANNQGLAAARGDYLALLNNDTYVTPGWVRTLMNHLRRDPSIGLIGPVTNGIGNEARIEIEYADMADMVSLATRYARRHLGRVFGLRTAGFFCVMMARTVYESVGALDEAFGTGFFEDDDYCRRVEALGLRVACAEDVFVHHRLSASFDTMGEGERRALFERNKALYEAKWGPWVPHSYR